MRRAGLYSEGARRSMKLMSDASHQLEEVRSCPVVGLVGVLPLLLKERVPLGVVPSLFHASVLSTGSVLTATDSLPELANLSKFGAPFE